MPDDATHEAMLAAHAVWAKAAAKRFEISPDDPQIELVGLVPFRCGFEKGMEYAQSLAQKE